MHLSLPAVRARNVSRGTDLTILAALPRLWRWRTYRTLGRRVRDSWRRERIAGFARVTLIERTFTSIDIHGIGSGADALHAGRAFAETEGARARTPATLLIKGNSFVIRVPLSELGSPTGILRTRFVIEGRSGRWIVGREVEPEATSKGPATMPLTVVANPAGQLIRVQITAGAQGQLVLLTQAIARALAA